MTLESTIIDLTSRTPSGGTCWIGEVPFTVSYCSDCWEWEFQGNYYFDPQDLSEAIEAFLEGLKAEARRLAPPMPEVQTKLRPGRGKIGHHGTQKSSSRTSVWLPAGRKASVRTSS